MSTHSEARSGSARSAPTLLPGDELLAPMPLAAMLVFGLNNWVLKATYGNWITGKLSDVTACLFVPFLVSAIMGTLGSKRSVLGRVVIGACLTAIVLTLVKTSTSASMLLDSLLAIVLPASLESTNTVDPTDLIALPGCVLAVLYARALDR